MSVDRFSALEERVSEYQAALLERGDTLSFNTQLLLGELRAALRGVPPEVNVPRTGTIARELRAVDPRSGPLGPFHEKVVREWTEDTGIAFYYCEECEATGDTATTVAHEQWCRLGAIEKLRAVDFGGEPPSTERVAAHGALRAAEEWAAGFPLGGGQDEAAAEDVHAKCREALRFFEVPFPAARGVEGEPRDSDVSQMLRRWAKPLHTLGHEADAIALERAADAIERHGMDSVFTVGVPPTDALREAAQALLDECAEGDFHYARSPSNGALDRLRAALQGSPKEQT